MDMSAKNTADDGVSMSDTNCGRGLGRYNKAVGSTEEGKFGVIERNVINRKQTEGVSTVSQKERTEKLLAVSLSNTLKNVRDLIGDQTVKEILSIIHNDSFDIDVFKKMVRSVEDCSTISNEIIQTCKEKY